MKEDGLGNVFLRHLFMAIPWGIVALVVFFVAAVGIKQEIKEGIQYGVRTAVGETTSLAFNRQLVKGVKQNIKEGIEFTAKTAKSEMKDLLKDSTIKQGLSDKES